MTMKKNIKFTIQPPNLALTQQYPDLFDYLLIETLGSGSFGKVIYAQNPQNFQEFAIKVINYKFIHDKRRFL